MAITAASIGAAAGASIAMPSPSSSGASGGGNPGAATADEALGLRFMVYVDGIGDLGDWQKGEGLSVEYDVFEYKEGGENSYVHRLPGRAKYTNIKLTRPIDPNSGLVSTWFG